jgi:class 3 adenylate cyclase
LYNGSLEALETLCQHQPTLLFGNSIGGWLVLRYALLHPDQVLGLVLASPFGAYMTPKASAELREVYRVETHADAVEMIDRVFYKIPVWIRPVMAWFALRQLSRPELRNPLDNPRPDLTFTRQNLAELQRPVKMLWGQADGVLPRAHPESVQSSLVPPRFHMDTPTAMKFDLERHTLGELIKLQEEVGKVLANKYQRDQALVFTDVVGSTDAFMRHGNAHGRALLQRHLSLLKDAIHPTGGRIVDTAGDGAFTVFDTVHSAAVSVISLQQKLHADNTDRPAHQKVKVRSAIHWGGVLTDGTTVTGDAVHLAARVCDTTYGQEIRLTKDAFWQLPTLLRLKCSHLPEVRLKGLPEPVQVMVLPWRDPGFFPTSLVLKETGEAFALPQKDVIKVGRLDTFEGRPANDIVLRLPDAERCRHISRWHIELLRDNDGMLVRSVSRGRTVVDGKLVAKGERTSVRVGTKVVLSKVATLEFITQASPELAGTYFDDEG